MTSLALDLACSLDPTLVLSEAGMEPDPWQREFLLSTTDQQSLMLCSRQSGKSTALGALGLHTALYAPNSLVLISPPASGSPASCFASCCRSTGRCSSPSILSRRASSDWS